MLYETATSNYANLVVHCKKMVFLHQKQIYTFKVALSFQLKATLVIEDRKKMV